MKRKAASSKMIAARVSKSGIAAKLESHVDYQMFMRNIDRRRVKYFTGNYRFNEHRVKLHCGSEQSLCSRAGGVLYWMSRDQRVQDNWAFIYAQKLSFKFKSNLHVCFCLVPTFLDATMRHYDFMLKGLEEVETECRNLNINFHLLIGLAKDLIPEFVTTNDIAAVVSDFSPLRLPLQWADDLSRQLPTHTYFCQVDSHNVVPVWQCSPKLEVGARTIRSKINNQLREYLTEFPPIIKHPNKGELAKPINWEEARQSIEVDTSVEPVTWLSPGTKAGLANLWDFIFSKRLSNFGAHRNNPTKDCLSNISPWLHFGQIAPQRCILEVNAQKSRTSDSVNSFVEETLIRRELSDNYCYYNANYDNIAGAPDWARKTLNIHKSDERTYKYTLEQLDKGKTHDKLWNSAQLQMVRQGKMHGFLRMYWAKKILEWTSEGPEEALTRAIWLNDRYSLDGRDPNGYVGIMWSICGLHDQGWKERNIFGKVRYMNYEGCRRKFDVTQFEELFK